MLVLLLVTLTAAAQGVILRDCRPLLAGRRPAQPLPRQTLVLPGAASAVSGTARQTGDVAQPTSIYMGERRQLVVLASFSDCTFQDADPLQLWNRIFNEPDFSEPPFYGSVHDYFYAQSYGRFSLTFDVMAIDLGQPRSRYRSTSQDDENSQYLVSDIVDQLSAMSVDWGQYDWDGDGYVNQLLIIYAGKGQNAGGGSNTIWPHQWWLSEHSDPKTGAPLSPRTVTDGEGGEYLVDCYCAVQELYSDGSYGSFGTICHEYSHCFGFPDFYNGTTSYVRQWDLMDYGCNNGGGFHPCGYSAHERMLMGWLTPVELTEPTTVSAQAALADAAEAYLVRNDGYADEYYIVENRQPTGWDASLPASGVVVFHVDYDPAVWTDIDGRVNSQNRQRYLIVPANNRSSYSQSAGWPYPYQDNNALTDDSQPAATLWHDNSTGERLMSKPLTNIAVSGGVASFDFMGGTTAISTVRPTGVPPQTLYSLGPVDIVRYADGNVRKVVRP